MPSCWKETRIWKHTGRLRALDGDFSLAGFAMGFIVAVQAIICRQINLHSLSCWFSMEDKVHGEARRASKTSTPSDLKKTNNKQTIIKTQNISVNAVDIRESVIWFSMDIK